MESIFFEKQEGMLCAQHALNALLQGAYFTAVDLAEVAKRLDRQEDTVMRGTAAISHNMDDSGFFSVQVMAEALKVWNLDLISLDNPRMVAMKQEPTSGKAFICNHREHWFTIRKIGFQWFNLNSLLTGPQLVSDTYLHLFLAQLRNDGYSIFGIVGEVPQSVADEVLMATPVDPNLAARSVPIREDQQIRDDPDLARAIALSLQNQRTSSSGGIQDVDMKRAIAASQEVEDRNDPSLQQALSRSLQMADSVQDNDLDIQTQKALQMSLLNHSVASERDINRAEQVSSSSPSNINASSGANQTSADPASVRQNRQAFLDRFHTDKKAQQ